jgi:O-methyltransferase involved in polyketide biosynthesis
MAAGDRDRIHDRMQKVADRWREHGFDINWTDLIFFDERTEVVEYLDAHGWATTASSLVELFAENGLPPIKLDDDDHGPFGSIVYVSATLK